MRVDRLAPPASRNSTTTIAVVLVACAVAVASWAIVRGDLSRHQDQTREAVQTAGRALADAAQQTLAAHGAITQSLAALVGDDGSIDEASFQRVATRLTAVTAGIRALELAPDGIIRHIHPVVGNEAALGLDLNRHSSGRPSMAALRAGTPVLVEGPVDLAQGGRAVVLRARVDVPGPTGSSPPRLWGVAIDVVDLGVFLEQMGLDGAPVAWSLRRAAGTAGSEVILGEDLGAFSPVSHTIEIPGGQWILDVVPKQGWPTTAPNFWPILAIGSVLGLALSLSAGRVLSEPMRLRQRVREASLELDRSNRHTRAIMNAAADAILAVDDTGRLVAWNPAARRLLRVQDADLDATLLHRHVDLDQIRLTESSEGHDIGRQRVIVTRSDGSTLPAEVSVATTAGNSLRTVVIRDVSDIDRREAELRRSVLELERLRQEHDAIKRDFMAMASHEVRTPITAIRGFALTLNRHWDQLDDEDRRRSLDVIQRQATRLWHVVSDVLTTSQLEGGSLDSRIARVHLRSIVEAAISEAQVPRSSVALECDAGLTARLDASQLSRILVALLTNAQKYGASPYVIAAQVDGTDLVIRVTDHGKGVPRAFLPLLFEPFSQASTGVTREAIGTGLGLSVARGLARASGGDVWHEDRETAGAVFAFRIPRAVPPPGEDHVPEAHEVAGEVISERALSPSAE